MATGLQVVVNLSLLIVEHRIDSLRVAIEVYRYCIGDRGIRVDYRFKGINARE